MTILLTVGQVSWSKLPDKAGAPSLGPAHSIRGYRSMVLATEIRELLFVF